MVLLSIAQEAIDDKTLVYRLVIESLTTHCLISHLVFFCGVYLIQDLVCFSVKLTKEGGGLGIAITVNGQLECVFL